MNSFTDNAGRTWVIAIHVEAVKRVRSLTGVNLLEIVEGKLIEKLIRDPVLLCDVVYAICRPEADARGVSDEDFGRAMAGDAIDQATEALLEELVGFLPGRRQRELLRRILDAGRKMLDRAADLVEQKLETGQLEQQIEAALAEDRPGRNGHKPGPLPENAKP